MAGEVVDPEAERLAVRRYIEEHDLEAVVSGAVNAVVGKRPADPCAALAEALAARRSDHGIDRIEGFPCFTELGPGVRVELTTSRRTFSTTCVAARHVRRGAPRIRSAVEADTSFVARAVEAIQHVVEPALRGMDVTRQGAVDRELGALAAAPAVHDEDGGTRILPRRVPREVLFAISRLVCAAGAVHLARSLPEHLRELAGISGGRLPPAPVPLVPLVAGGAGTVSALPWESIAVAPVGAPSVQAALDLAAECEGAVRKLVEEASEGAQPLAAAAHRGGALDVAGVESAEGALALAVRAVDVAEARRAEQGGAGSGGEEGKEGAAAAVRAVLVASLGMDACERSALPPVRTEGGEGGDAEGKAAEPEPDREGPPRYVVDFKEDGASEEGVGPEDVSSAAQAACEACPLLRVLLGTGLDEDVESLRALSASLGERGRVLAGDVSGLTFAEAAARADAAVRGRGAAASVVADGTTEEEWRAAEERERWEEEERAAQRRAEEEARRKAEEEKEAEEAAGAGKGKGKKGGGKVPAAEGKEEPAAGEEGGGGEDEGEAALEASDVRDPREACGSMLRVRAADHGTVQAALRCCVSAQRWELPFAVATGPDGWGGACDDDAAFDVALAAACGATFVEVGSLRGACGRRRAEALLSVEDAVVREKRALASVLQGRYSGRAGQEDAARPVYVGPPLLTKLQWEAELGDYVGARAERMEEPLSPAGGSGGGDKGKKKKK